MKKAQSRWWSRQATLRIGLIPIFSVMLLLVGCEELSLPIHRPAGKYQPLNVYSAGEVMPVRIKRVAVLPIATTDSSALLISGVDTLAPLLQSELAKARRFESVTVSAEQLTQWYGKSSWNTEERLPRDLFERLHDLTACDAVLFCRLTRYQPYPPLVVGWKMSLVENEQKNAFGEPQTRTIWSVDELFDAGDPAVGNSAQSYYTQHLRRESPASESSTVLASPSRFGQYTLSAVLETMPKR